MADCNKIIVTVYNHPDILRLISKIHPESLRDDLRQEIAMSLLEQPCEKVAGLFAGDNLIKYSIRMCWVMATSKTSNFYYKYKKKDISKAVEYLQSIESAGTIPTSIAYKAKKAIQIKSEGNIYDDHEARVFNKFVELGSARAVARFYSIPVNHTCKIIQKVKKELKCMLLP